MQFTKTQISNFLNNNVSFRFSISDNNRIKFDEYQEFFTFDEVEKIVKSNFDYWNSISDKEPNHFQSNWRILSDRIKSIRAYFSEIETLNLEDTNNYIYRTLSSNRVNTEQDKLTYIISIDSPIDRDKEFRKIKSFITFYIGQTEINLVEAVRNFIYLSKNMNIVGNYLSNSSHYQFYPALFLLRKYFSNIRENVSDFEKNIVAPLSNKLQAISDDSDKQYREITAFTETKYDEIQQQFDDKISELEKFQESINNWQIEKQDKFSDLEETYKNKLSLEEPEKLWNERASEYRKQARNWTIALVIAVVALILAFIKLVLAIHSYSLNIIKEIPFISESFIFISVISFFIYIVRVLIKIVMSNHHLAAEYMQKAALTRFYQSLTYAGTYIDKEERLIIINSLFSRVDTGLIKTDSSNDSEAILAILSKNIK